MNAIVDASVHSRLVQHLFEQSRRALVLTMLVSAVLGSLVWLGPAGLASVSAETVLTWWAATAAVVLLRTLVSWRYFRAVNRRRDWSAWLNRYALGAGLTGLCWGFGGMALLAESGVIADAIILLVIAAITVSAIPYLAMERLPYLCYFAGAMLPLLAGMLLDGDTTMRYFAAFVVVFSMGVWLAALRFNELLQSSLSLKIQSDRLSRQVQDSNEQLASANLQLELDIERREQVAIELQHARQAAERANHAKSQFLSRMSHELRTPLNAILGFSELLSVLSVEEIHQHREGHLANIQAAGRHLLSLIDDVLDVARLDSGEVEFRPEQIVVAEVIDECAAILAPQLSEKSIDFRFNRADAGELSLFADRLRLRQVFLNLLSNAIKYNREYGCVCVSVEPASHSYVGITVTDDGVGISEEDIGRIFDPFVRVGDDTQRVQGTGIGLTITRQLVKYMEGSIDVRNRASGGTEFVVTLPMRTGATADAANEDAADGAAA